MADLFSNPVTWKSLAYVVLEVPIGFVVGSTGLFFVVLGVLGTVGLLMGFLVTLVVAIVGPTASVPPYLPLVFAGGAVASFALLLATLQRCAGHRPGARRSPARRLVLISNPGRAFSREFLVERIWGTDFDGFDRAVDTHVTRLRRKLGRLGDRIVTVWGVGYRFTPPGTALD